MASGVAATWLRWNPDPRQPPALPMSPSSITAISSKGDIDRCEPRFYPGWMRGHVAATVLVPVFGTENRPGEEGLARTVPREWTFGTAYQWTTTRMPT
jgi:hypothetical protein